jgi:hypothetical protein
VVSKCSRCTSRVLSGRGAGSAPRDQQVCEEEAIVVSVYSPLPKVKLSPTSLSPASRVSWSLSVLDPCPLIPRSSARHTQLC